MIKEYELFCGMPQFMWECAFEFIRLIVVGIILGVFASRYQKRKEIELQIRGRMVTRKIDNLETIEKFTAELYNKIAPPLSEQSKIVEILDVTCMDDVLDVEYNSILASMESFDDYYKRLHVALHEAHHYMSYRMERMLSEFGCYLTELKCLMDAFCDTEHDSSWHFSDRIAKSHIDFAYQVVGVALQQDINRFFCIIDRQVAREMRNVNLSFGHGKWVNVWWRLKQFMLMKIERYIDDNGWVGRLCHYLYYGYIYRTYGHSRLILSSTYIVLILMYVHYSGKASAKTLFEQIEKNDYLLKQFHAVYANYLHH